jgi:ABC-type Fe3+/spermidine/putrescine transport system ATPase subunit
MESTLESRERSEAISRDAQYVVLESVTKRFDKTIAVKALDLSIRRGEFFTLLGPSGCGKSTTLSIVAGLERPDGGTLYLSGRDITDQPPESRGIGLVFQNYALFPHMTVLENVLFPLRMRGVPTREALERARDALRMVKLSIENAKPNQISGGQAQRVALARALVYEPRLLLMDEPLAALDRRLRQAMQFELRSLQQRLETTFIYVTHDQEEALVLSDRIAIMDEGALEQVGSPADVYDRPATRFVANFMGESNIMPVQVLEGSSDSVLVEALGGRLRFRASTQAKPVGDSGAIMVRPERVAVVRTARDVPEGNVACEAVVVDVVFLGDHSRIAGKLEDGLVWTARISRQEADDMSALPTVAHSALFHWPRSAAIYLP